MEKEVNFVFNHLMKNQSYELLKLSNDMNTGIGAVLRILKESTSLVTAKKISEIMCVSEARIAVLLRKTEKRGYIIREKDSNDGRITIVKLTSNGEMYAQSLYDALCKNIEIIIESIGFENIKQYISLTEEINNVIQNKLTTPPKID